MVVVLVVEMLVVLVKMVHLLQLQITRLSGVSTPPSTSSSKVRSSGLSSGDKSSTKSLEETGFNDTVEKNISNKLEEDFKIDPRLKKAFGDSLALPMKGCCRFDGTVIKNSSY